MIKNNNGFTLVELVATIAIMLIIVSIALPTSLRFIEEGKTEEFNLIVDKIEVAAQDYYNENDVSSTTIQLSDLIDYVDLDNKYFKGNKIKDPREDGKCLNGNITIESDTTINVKDKVELKYNEVDSIDC